MKIKTKSRIDHVDGLLRRACEASRINQRNHRVRQYLGSHDAKLLAALQAYEAMSPDRRPDKAKLESIARDLNPWKGTDEPVLVHWKPKASYPYYRTVLEFGIRHRANQYLVRDVLSWLLELHPHQYLLRGGVHEAIRRTAKALREGFQWAVEIDISKCYESFDGEELTKLLPLPKEVTENITISDHLNLVPGNLWYFYGPADDDEGDPVTLAAALASARLGIPQGSASSPLIAEAMVAIALKQLPTLGVVTAYADNILVTAKSESDCASVTETLLAALEGHPVGRLRPYPRTFKYGESIKFLGHRLIPLNGCVRIEPDDDNSQKFKAKVKSELAYLSQAMPTASWRKRREGLERYIRSWTAAFKLCDEIQSLRSHWLGRIPVN